MRAFIASILLPLAALPCTSQPPKESASKPDRAALLKHWRDYVFSDGHNEANQKKLLECGEESLDVLLDLLCGSKELADLQRKVDNLVAALGDDVFAVRETASVDLKKLLPTAHDLLIDRLSNPDAEIRRRIVLLIGEDESAYTQARFRIRLRKNATAVLESQWPVQHLRSVCLRNLDRLAGIESVESDWCDRPIYPFLASLRYSRESADREKLGAFVLTARPGAAQTALQLMRDGIANISGGVSDGWRVPLPEHDYAKYAFECLDTEREGVFRAAMNYLAGDKRLPAVLHRKLPAIQGDRLRDEIHAVLWLWHRDAPTKERYLSFLASADDSKFEKAVSMLCDIKCLEMGPEIIPLLIPALKGDDEYRRKLVLDKLDRYDGLEAVALAADAAAPFLASRVESERVLAARVISALQAKDRGDVLGHILAKHTEGPVHDAASNLLKQREAKK